MSAELLEIQPSELKFICESKKPSSCSVQLVNNSNNHVAFKIKTTSPKKYSVRPTTGIIKPISTCDVIVTMQAHRLAPPDMICNDKFLVQSTVVPSGTTDEDITSSLFAKDAGRYVEENKLKVILVSPPNYPALSPLNGTFKQVPPEDVEGSKMEKSEEIRPAKDVEYKTMKDVQEPATDVEHKQTKDAEVPAKGVEHETMKDEEELKLGTDIEEMKLKLSELKVKLSQAEVTISKLTEEGRLTAQERESIRQELALFRSERGVRNVQIGFPFLFVCMVALISVTLGYVLHR
ncbi:Vesicle-associated protein 2-2, N-terminally processed like [Actinidia chinensis var. chinensis]|uniref:Vesicle-associated protein 2-2, N-terminally processed like n=1 Tax=Actinidia chinensis var. chinensis TaxID=1590841 RepID=A0A2R6R302_ACTCC|nr:Vesicle-associated protein 2-2, N-terminally processed like [Actinidia chinensis var. chinensis]